jgi:hypothetical protein
MLCVALLLLATLMPGTSAGLLALFVPFWFFFAALIPVRRLAPIVVAVEQRFPYLSALASRAPPVA